MKIKNSANLVAAALRLIRAEGPILAIDIAHRLALTGSRETLRRRVRSIVQHLRNDNGVMIVADLRAGYFATEDKKIWQDYLDGRQISAKKILGTTHKQLKMVTDSNGQGLLFLPGVGSLDNNQFMRHNGHDTI